MLHTWKAGCGDGSWGGYDLLVSTENFQDAGAPVRVLESCAVAAVLVTSAAVLRSALRSRSAAPLVLPGLAVAVAIGWSVTSGAEVMGLLPAVPALALLGLWRPRERWERLVASVALLYTAGVVATGSEGGLQWGPRYLLPAIPLLVWLGCLGATRALQELQGHRRRALLATVSLLGVASVGVQLAGVARVRAQVQAVEYVEGVLRASGSPVLVTGREGLFRAMGFLYFDKVLMVVDSPPELHALVELLAAHKVPRWTYVPFSGPAFDARLVERWTQSGRWRFRVAADTTPGVDVRERGGGFTLRLVTYAGGR